MLVFLIFSCSSSTFCLFSVVSPSLCKYCFVLLRPPFDDKFDHHFPCAGGRGAAGSGVCRGARREGGALQSAALATPAVWRVKGHAVGRTLTLTSLPVFLTSSFGCLSSLFIFYWIEKNEACNNKALQFKAAELGMASCLSSKGCCGHGNTPWQMVGMLKLCVVIVTILV